MVKVLFPSQKTASKCVALAGQTDKPKLKLHWSLVNWLFLQKPVIIISPWISRFYLSNLNIFSGGLGSSHETLEVHSTHIQNVPGASPIKTDPDIFPSLQQTTTTSNMFSQQHIPSSRHHSGMNFSFKLKDGPVFSK